MTCLIQRFHDSQVLQESLLLTPSRDIGVIFLQNKKFEVTPDTDSIEKGSHERTLQVTPTTDVP